PRAVPVGEKGWRGNIVCIFRLCLLFLRGISQPREGVRNGNYGVWNTNHHAGVTRGWCGVVWCGVEWCGVVWCGVEWCGAVRCGVEWCGVVWCVCLCVSVCECVCPRSEARRV